MFKKWNYFQNFPALNFAITYGAINLTAAVSKKHNLNPIFYVDRFYTLLKEGILVLSIHLKHLEIMILDPMFLGDI